MSGGKCVVDGKIAGLYDLEETIGKGHYAVVKLARHVFTGERVAVKVIDKTKLDEISRAHLFQEVRCMKLVQHPHVVRLYEVIDTATRLYLVLEWGDGGDMYDYIMKHDGGLDEVVARRYFGQIVQAIDYCHRLHVVHRDLKPENVVFFETSPEVGGIVKLTDFGFSNKFVPGRKLETSCGSLAYSAPEILLGDSYDAPAVDIWSLGVILYMLVCGEPPFQEANDSETLTMIMDCRYRMPDHVSPLCRDIIGRMLVREPSQRATLFDIASHPWMADGTSSGAVASASHLSTSTPLVCREALSEEDHSHIIQRIVDGKIASRDDVVGSLESSAYNHITATYYLLAERLLRKRAEANQATESTTTGSESSIGDIAPILSPIALSPRIPFPPVDLFASGDHVDNPISAPTIVVGSSAPGVPSAPSPIAAPGLHTEINMLMCRCAMIHEDSLEVFENDADDDGGNMTTIDQSHSDSEVPDEADLFDAEHMGLGTLLEVPSVRGVTKLVPAPATGPNRPLVSVRSSPQLLNEICEETESVDDEDEMSISAAATSTAPRISRRHSTETPRHLERLHRVHRRKLASLIPRVASCSSSDASDTDEVDQRKHHRKHKSNAAVPSAADAACIKALNRRDSSEHSSDNDNQSGGIVGGGGGGDSGSSPFILWRNPSGTGGQDGGYSGNRRGAGHMDSVHEEEFHTENGYCSDICVSSNIHELDNAKFISQRYSDYQLSDRRCRRKLHRDADMNSRNQSLTNVMRLRSSELGDLVEEFGGPGFAGMKRWQSAGKFRNNSKLDLRRETHAVAAALLAKLGCSDVLRCHLRTRKVSL